MHGINTLKALNEAAYIARQKAALKNGSAENETNRRSSFVESRGGIVIHSAKRRSTAFIGGARNVKNFLAKIWGTNSLDRRDEIIEGYFA